MRILITGISGFVGPHLARELSEAGHDVRGLDRTPTENTHACDLTKDQAVLDFFSSHSYDWVIHLAALTSVQDSFKEPQKFLDMNTGMTRNIYHALRETSAKTSVLLTSSSDVYGPQEIFPITEEATPHPQNPYAESKLAQESVAAEFPEVKTIISRSFNHTGPGASESLVVGAFAKQIARCELGLEQEIKVGNLEAKRDFLDVRDVVHAYRLLIEKATPGNIYNICSGTTRSIQSILDTLLSFTSKDVPVVEDPERMRPSDVPEFWGSHEKITNETKWNPSIPFDQTLNDAYIWWLKKLQNEN